MADHLNPALYMERQTHIDNTRFTFFFNQLYLLFFVPKMFSVVLLFHSEVSATILNALTLKRPSSLYPPVIQGGAVLGSW